MMSNSHVVCQEQWLAHDHDGGLATEEGLMPRLTVILPVPF
jgi:hypothetical protein